MKRKNGKKDTGDLATGWVKLAGVMVANTTFRDSLDSFLNDPETLVLREAAPDLCRELMSMHETLAESLGIMVQRAAGAVAG